MERFLASPAGRAVLSLFVVLAAVVASAALIQQITVTIPLLPKNPAVEMGSIIVLSVAAVIFLVFLMAVGFSGLGLSDKKEALGLPSGSVRALIAVLLLLMFVFFAIFLFARIADPTTVRVPGLTAAQVTELGTAVFATVTQDNTITAFIRIPVSEATERFAAQIFTATLTLATAVSSFYFATRTAEGALTALTAETKEAGLSLSEVRPAEGTASQRADVEIVGSGFVSSTKVKLRRAGAEIPGVDVDVESSARIRCGFNLPPLANAGQPEDWDLYALNPDGTDASKSGAFKVTP